VKKYVHLIFISSDWEDYHRKIFTQTINENFKSWSDVYLIQYPISLTVNLFIKFKKKFLGFLTGKYKLKEIENGIMVYTPFILFHINLWTKIKFLKFIDVFILSFLLNSLIKKFKNKKIILWVYIPEHFLVIKKLKYDFLVYDFYDNYIYTLDGTLNEEKNYYNDELIKKSNLVICTAKVMFENAIKQNANSIYLPNANNAGNRNFKFDEKIKTELLNIEEPIIGYVGNIRDWIDFELIEFILKNYEEAKIVFVGPIDKTAKKYVKRLETYNNFMLIGNKPLDLIPYYLKSFRVGIIPFKHTKFTEGVMPIKFFEYLNAEIPIVTTNLPDFKFYKEYIGYSESYEEFLNNCKAAINGDFENKVKYYKKLAEENTWEKRVEVLERIFIREFAIKN
jgi:hypothetical protein